LAIAYDSYPQQLAISYTTVRPCPGVQISSTQQSQQPGDFRRLSIYKEGIPSGKLT